MRDEMRRMVARLIRWAVVETAGNDAGAFPIQQISYLGRAGDSSAWFPYGFHARATKDDLALLMAISGQADSRVHFPGSPKDRPRIEEGEVVLYHPKTGSKVYLKKDGVIEIVSAVEIKQITPLATLEADEVVITGNLTVDGAADFTGILNANGDLNDQNGIEMSAHVHNDTIHPSTDNGPPKDP